MSVVQSALRCFDWYIDPFAPRSVSVLPKECDNKLFMQLFKRIKIIKGAGIKLCSTRFNNPPYLLKCGAL